MNDFRRILISLIFGASLAALVLSIWLKFNLPYENIIRFSSIMIPVWVTGNRKKIFK